MTSYATARLVRAERCFRTNVWPIQTRLRRHEAAGGPKPSIRRRWFPNIAPAGQARWWRDACWRERLLAALRPHRPATSLAVVRLGRLTDHVGTLRNYGRQRHNASYETATVL